MLYALTDNIRSAYNIGSIFRTADGAGFDKVILTGFSPTPQWSSGRGERPAHYSDKSARQISKTALEAEKYLSWEYQPDALKVVAELKKREFFIIALENNVADSQNLFDFQPKNENLCLCLGHEVTGLSEALIKAADVILSIPMYGQKESLNVAVAFGVAAYCLKQH